MEYTSVLQKFAYLTSIFGYATSVVSWCFAVIFSWWRQMTYDVMKTWAHYFEGPLFWIKVSQTAQTALFRFGPLVLILDDFQYHADEIVLLIPFRFLSHQSNSSHGRQSARHAHFNTADFELELESPSITCFSFLTLIFSWQNSMTTIISWPPYLEEMIAPPRKRKRW